MPFITFNDTVSDSGAAALGGSRVFYVAWQMTTRGPTVRNPSPWDLDTLLGLGHWELGNSLDSGGLIFGVGYDAPHWMGWEIGQWIAPPGVSGTEYSAAIADHIRWTVEAGSEVHLIVLGDA